MPQLSSVIRWVRYVFPSGVKTEFTLQVKENGRWVDVTFNQATDYEQPLGEDR